MTRSLIEDAFAHHVWATKRLAETCLDLTPEQLATPVSGIYGSILDTMRHIADGDSFYLSVLGDERTTLVEPDRMDMAQLLAAADALGAEWVRVLIARPDPDAVIKEVDADDGFQREATVGLRLAQALHHGNDHRSQICTALSVLGVEPPDVSAWRFGLETGRSVEVLPAS